ncbi:MAG: trypsin-like peptidase domain-containing protein [Clostridia bacterium]|nr:trypsin-like peptidase domain-containing protein [Clostridia bacterium]
MDEFYEYDYDSKNKKDGIGKYILVAVISAVITCLLLFYIGSSFGFISMEQSDKTDSEDGQEQEQIIGEDSEVFTQENTTNIGSDTPIIDIAKNVGSAVVGIVNKMEITRGFFENEISEGSGSGIIISDDGYIVTNNHVIENASELVVILPGGEKVNADLVGKDSKTDLAVIKINKKNLPAAKLGDSDRLQVGETVVAIGNPLGSELAGSVTSGIISSTQRDLVIDGKQLNLIQTDAAINPGNSGGALVNLNGEVIGINTAKQQGVGIEGIGFAIPINDAKPVIQQLIENGYVSRPALGIVMAEINEKDAKEYNVPVGIGVSQVMINGPADKAGIVPGDIILEVEGQEVKKLDEMQKQLEKFKSGDAVNMVVWRDGKEYNISVKLGEYSKVFSE